MAASGLAAQGRIALPEGSVILVRTTAALQSASAQVGQTFETTVIETVGVDEFTVIPQGSRIRGTMTYVQPATRNRSGVIEVHFDRLVMTDGSEMAISGKLTSTDPTERRQIENDPNARVVLVGGRGRVGAGILGAGSERDPASTILVALGNMLSGSSNVNVPSGTALAVQLEQPLVLRGRGRRPADSNTIFTSADYIRAAQQALARANYYRGSVNGQLNDATQRALFEFQIDKGITATGNLDWRTARALGININDANTGGGAGTGVIAAEEIASIRRNAQNVLGSARESLGISAVGRLNPARSYSDADFELWFALSSFADNVSLFEQLVRQSGNSQNTGVAARALANAARRVEAALQLANESAQVRNGWSALMSQLSNAGIVYR
jgi:peptidoglycan hydrolase-like protein with peptidoglycan-binding domain